MGQKGSRKITIIWLWCQRVWSSSTLFYRDQDRRFHGRPKSAKQCVCFLSTARPNHYSTHTPTTDVSSKNPAITQSIVDAAVAASMSNSSSGPHSSHNNSSNSNNNGSIGLRKPKAKRTWSKEEEEALVEGLKEVGPSWSKILDLYGPGGKITENLKNRTQVQLKDKARNWKLQYLKSGKPLPDYLIKVTGNLEKIYKAKKNSLNLQIRQLLWNKTYLSILHQLHLLLKTLKLIKRIHMGKIVIICHLTDFLAIVHRTIQVLILI